jgi:hypothetical protein
MKWVTSHGVRYRVIDFFGPFILIEDPKTGEECTILFGTALEAYEKATTGTRDKGEKSKAGKIHATPVPEERDREKIASRMLQAKALNVLAEAWKIHADGKINGKRKNLPPELSELLVVAFGEVVFKSLHAQADTSVAIENVRNAFGNGFRSLRTCFHKPSKSRRRTIVVMQAGLEFVLEHKTAPTKKFLRRFLECRDLCFGSKRTGKLNEQWRNFFLDNGLDELDEG